MTGSRVPQVLPVALAHVEGRDRLEFLALEDDGDEFILDAVLRVQGVPKVVEPVNVQLVLRGEDDRGTQYRLIDGEPSAGNRSFGYPVGGGPGRFDLRLRFGPRLAPHAKILRLLLDGFAFVPNLWPSVGPPIEQRHWSATLEIELPEGWQAERHAESVRRRRRLQDQTTFFRPDLLRINLNRLRALRGLPPGTALGQPIDPDGRRVVSELIALPEHMDPLVWLAGHRAELTSRLLLRKVLDRVQHSFRMAHPRPPADDPFAGIDLTSATEDQLEHVLVQVRALPAWDFPYLGGEEVGRLAEDLLDMSTSETLAWIRSERPQLAAAVALWEATAHILPSGHDLAGLRQTTRREPVGADLVSSDRFTLQAVELELGLDGAILHLRMRNTLPNSLESGGDVSGHTNWAGWDDITDDLGHHYVSWCHGRVSAAKTPEAGWSCEGPIEVRMYPALAAGVNRLTFRAEPSTAYVSVYENRQHGGLRWVPVDMENLVWSLLVPMPQSGERDSE